MTAATTISPAADAAARLDLLTDYRRKRQHDVPLAAIGQLRDSFARSLARVAVHTGAVDAYLAAGFAAADAYYELVWSRWQKDGANYWRDGAMRGHAARHTAAT